MPETCWDMPVKYFSAICMINIMINKFLIW